MELESDENDDNEPDLVDLRLTVKSLNQNTDTTALWKGPNAQQDLPGKCLCYCSK